jgi:phosphate:Na+ symporter
MFHLNDALQKAAGNRFRQLLITLTSSNGRGLVSGLFVTLFNQSSSATTVLEVSLVSAGLLTFYQTMAVTMGAEIGSTVTGQLIAFRLTDYAVFISGLGFYISFFMGKDRRWKYIEGALQPRGPLTPRQTDLLHEHYETFVKAARDEIPESKVVALRLTLKGH